MSFVLWHFVILTNCLTIITGHSCRSIISTFAWWYYNYYCHNVDEWVGALISYAVLQYRPMDEAIYPPIRITYWGWVSLTGQCHNINDWWWCPRIYSPSRRRRRINEGRRKSIKFDHLLWCVCWAALIPQEVYRNKAAKIYLLKQHQQQLDYVYQLLSFLLSLVVVIIIVILPSVIEY